MKQKNMVRGACYGILAALTYSIMATLVKVSSGVSIEILVFFRNVISISILLPFMMKRKIRLKTKYLRIHMVRSLSGLLGLYAYFYALRQLPLMNAILLSNTSPLFIPLVVVIWLKSKISKRRVIFLMLGFLGVGFILQPTLDFPLIPSLVGISAGLFIAIAMTSVRALSKLEPTESILFYFFSFSIFVSFFPMIFAWQSFETAMWFYILGVGLAATLFQYFITKTYFYLPATKAGCFIYLSVLFGGTFEILLFGTIPNYLVIIGTAFIVLGGMLTLMDKHQKK